MKPHLVQLLLAVVHFRVFRRDAGGTLKAGTELVGQADGQVEVGVDTMVIAAVPAVGYAVGHQFHVEVQSLVDAGAALQTQAAHEAAGVAERAVEADTGQDADIERTFMIPLDELAEVHHTVYRSSTVVEAVGLVRVPLAYTALPATDGQAGAPYVGEILADRQLRGRAYQFAERHIATAVGRANLTLDEPGIFLFLGACCCQATGQQQGASYECLL